MNKSILIISPFFFPEPISTAKYNTKLAEELLNRNCQVTVICSHPIYPYWKPQKTNAGFSSINIIRGGAKIMYPRSPILRRAVLELWYTVYLIRFLLFHRKKFELIVSIIPPSLNSFLLRKIAHKSTRIITIIHDLQIVYAKHKMGLKSKLLTFIIGYVEKKVLQNSNSTVFLSETMQRKAAMDFKINFRNSIVSYPFVSIIDSKSTSLERKFNADTFNIVYAGALGEKQNPNLLMEFCKQILQTDLNISIKIFSAGPIFEDLKVKYAAYHKIEFDNLVPEQELLHLYRISDLQLIPQIDGSDEGSIPSKLPNLLISGVPILAVCEENSEIASILSKFTQSYSLFTWDYNKFESIVRYIIKNTKNHSWEETSKERINSPLMKKFRINDLINHILNVEN